MRNALFVIILITVLGFCGQASAQQPDYGADHRDILAMLARGECHFPKYQHWTRRDITGGVSGLQQKEAVKLQYETACKAYLDQAEQRANAGTCPRIRGFMVSDYIDRGLSAQQADTIQARDAPEFAQKRANLAEAEKKCF